MIDSNVINERILEYYSNDYELTTPCLLGDTVYDAYAEYQEKGCYDYAFVRNTLTLSKSDLRRFRDEIAELIEPELVRKGNPSPRPGHMYSYITGIFISERRIRPEVCDRIRKFRYYKAYGFFTRGYCQARIAAFDLETGALICSPAAKELMQEYGRILK